jgi:hypothetical protein
MQALADRHPPAAIVVLHRAEVEAVAGRPRAIRVIVNYSPDRAVRCDLDGKPDWVLSRANRLSEMGLPVGGKLLTPEAMAHTLGAL